MNLENKEIMKEKVQKKVKKKQKRKPLMRPPLTLGRGSGPVLRSPRPAPRAPGWPAGRRAARGWRTSGQTCQPGSPSGPR